MHKSVVLLSERKRTIDNFFVKWKINILILFKSSFNIYIYIAFITELHNILMWEGIASLCNVHFPFYSPCLRKWFYFFRSVYGYRWWLHGIDSEIFVLIDLESVCMKKELKRSDTEQTDERETFSSAFIILFC